MERRVLLAALLSVITVVAFQFMTGQCSPQQPKKPAEGQSPDGDKPVDPAVKPAEPGANGASPAGGPAVPPVAGAPPAPPAPTKLDLRWRPDGERVELVSEELRIGLTSRGAAVEYIQVERAHDPGRSDPFVLVAPANPYLPLGGVDEREVNPPAGESPGSAWRRDPTPGALRASDWSRDTADEAATPEQGDAVYVLETPDGFRWRKQWFVTRGADKYDLRLRISVKAKDGTDRGAQAVKLLASANLLANEPTGTLMGLPMEALYALTSENELAKVDKPETGFEKREVKAEGLGADSPSLVGVRSQYFLVGAYAAPGLKPMPAERLWATGEEADTRPVMGENLKAWFEAKTGRVASADKDAGLLNRLKQATDHMLYAWVGLSISSAPTAEPVEVAFYAGPVSREVLRTDDYRPIAPVITYPGAPDWLAEVLLWIYDRWRMLVGAGWAVVLLTLTVRGLLMPISIKNQLGMRRYGRKVQKLKPKIALLQKKWASNPQRLRQEQMLLYREHGIGFPMGCLMMLLQIPIFFALFGSVRVEYSLLGQSFLWIRDLALPDRLIDLPRNFPIISSINLLPILMIVISIYQTRLMPKPTDEQQAQQMKMMKWMPILFAVVLYNYTAALALYMVVSSTVAIFESKIVKHRDEAEQAAAALPPA